MDPIITKPTRPAYPRAIQPRMENPRVQPPNDVPEPITTPAMAEVQQVKQAAVKTSLAGVASITLGVISLALCWVSGMGVIAILLSALGMFLGLVELKGAMLEKGNPLSIALAGCVISLAGFVLALSMTTSGSNGFAREIMPRPNTLKEPTKPPLERSTPIDRPPPVVPMSNG